MPHNTTIFVDGEKAVSTMLHMKVCVHFEVKEKVASAIARVLKGAGYTEATEENWQQACKTLNANELEKFNWYFAVNRITCPEECPARHF